MDYCMFWDCTLLQNLGALPAGTLVSVITFDFGPSILKLYINNPENIKVPSNNPDITCKVKVAVEVM